MAKWLMAVGGVAALVVILLWKLAEAPDKPGAVAKVHFDAGSGRLPHRAIKPEARIAPPRPRPPDAAPEQPAVERLDPTSEAFQRRVDVVIPMKLRAAAAHCYDGGLDDRTLKIHYQLRILHGDVFATNVYTSKSELGDKELERCMVNAVEQARWQSDDLPDLDEEQELFIRLRTLKKYKKRLDEPDP